MSFNTAGGILFALSVVIVSFLIRGRKQQNALFLIASLYFYATSSLVYLSLLLLVIGIGYLSGLLLKPGAISEGKRKEVLFVSIGLTLGILGVFKYYDFFVESFANTLTSLGLAPNFATLHIVLPVGVSFYIFQTIGYLIDVYRHDTEPEEDLTDFALFVSFFPQLVAGPIERSRNLLRQVKLERPVVGLADVKYGMYLIAQGFVKKTVIADNLAPMVDTIFSEENISGPLVWVGLLLFAIQIYCDFSGYTDIARGYSRLLGFRLLLNFDRPYAATSPSNFWRRWHISLSSWFTEYVYFAIGGNRSKSSIRRSSNVIATMSLSGLWHGASLNFILWGGYHGVIILLGRLVERPLPTTFTNSSVARILGIVVTFILSVYGWLYFRITDIDLIYAYNVALVSDFTGIAVALAFLTSAAFFLVIWVLLDLLELFWLRVHDHEVKERAGLVLYIALMFSVALVFHAESPANFIYFRF